MEALIFCIISAGPPSNRPPQMALAPVLLPWAVAPDPDFFEFFVIVLNLIETPEGTKS
jgi:hypothetical protein